MTTYAPSETVKLEFSAVSTEDGTPETGTLDVTRPDGTAYSVTVTGPAGAQVALVDADMVGRWTYLWESPNGGQRPGTFTVGPTLVSVADLRRHLNNNKAADEAELASKLDAALASVERAVGPIAPRSFTEIPYGPLLRHRPVVAVTAVNGLAVPVGVTLNLEAGLIYGLYMGDAVTYEAGWGAQPDLLEAVLIVAARLWETQRSAATGPLGLDENGNPISTGGLPLMPPRAQALLQPYVSVGGIG